MRLFEIVRWKGAWVAALPEPEDPEDEPCEGCIFSGNNNGECGDRPEIFKSCGLQSLIFKSYATKEEATNAVTLARINELLI